MLDASNENTPNNSNSKNKPSSQGNLNNHSKPNNDNTSGKSKTSGRKVLLLLAVIFVLPFTLAATLHLLDLRPTGKSYGDLIQPPKELNFINLQNSENKTLPPKQWLKIWSIVMVDNAGCTVNCQSQVQLVKQVHTSLGKEYKRIQRLLIVTTDIAASDLNALKLNNPNLKIVANNDAQTLKFAQQFGSATNTNGKIYLVDPLGNLMMSYTKDHDLKGLRSDLTRLLKNSWAG